MVNFVDVMCLYAGDTVIKEVWKMKCDFQWGFTISGGGASKKGYTKKCYFYHQNNLLMIERDKDPNWKLIVNEIYKVS